MILKTQPLGTVRTKAVLIEIEGGQSLMVTVQSPTIEQLAGALGDLRERWAADRPGKVRADVILAQIQQVVVGWQDVTDEKGHAVPFTWVNLKQMTNQSPELFQGLSVLAENAFDGYLGFRPKTEAAGDASKNSEGPSPTSAPAAAATPELTNTSSTPELPGSAPICLG